MRGMDYHGFSFINVFTPCVTYNKYNTYEWFKEHLTDVSDVADYDPADKARALTLLNEREGLVTGVLYEEKDRPSYEDLIDLAEEPLAAKVETINEKTFTDLIAAFR